MTLYSACTAQRAHTDGALATKKKIIAEGFLSRHYECELVFETQRTQHFLGGGTYEKVQANNDNNDEKKKKRNSQRAESISHIH